MKYIFCIFTLFFSVTTLAQQVERKNLVQKIKTGPSFKYAVKCMKNGESALASSDSSNFNIAEFNGEFDNDKVEYWKEKDNMVTKHTLKSEQIVNVTPINNKGCFLLKYKD